MCGLFGLYAPGGADPQLAHRAVAAMRHRGPDAQRVWRSACGRLVLGHARLKVLDLSEDANQPMHSRDGRWSLVFNGEIVNYRDVRAAYKGPWKFRTSGDSEVLLATYAARGAAAMHDWVGMFAFGLHDGEQETLTLARDRFGIKPLYLIDLPDGGLAFASEIPPLLPLLKQVRADADVIRTYLETGLYDHTERTFFAGVEALPQGTWLELDLATGQRKAARWYDLARHVTDLSAACGPELLEEGTRRVETAIRDHLVADVKVGLNVSGGVDSSVLVGIAREHVRDIELFTQDYEPPYSEAAWVREVAGGCPLHLVALKSEDILAVLAETVRRQAEPFGGTSVCGYDGLYAAADAAGVTVLLDGNGADEAFLGYKKYHADFVSASGDDATWRARAAAYSEFWNEAAPPRGETIPGGRSIDGTIGVRPDAMATALVQSSSTLGLSMAGMQDARGPKADAMSDLLATKIPRGLRFNDRMSMGRSKELRVPFLDHRVVEFGLAVPAERLLNEHGSKALFRKIATRWVPDNVAFAAKRSVQSPQREWLRQHWRPFVSGLLGSESFADRGWIDPARATGIYDDYCRDGGDNSFFIWQWLNLELWAREFLA